MRALADLLICLRFFSRLPVPATSREEELGVSGFAAAAAMVPLAGAIVGLVPAVVLVAAMGLGVPSLPAAALAITALILATGALHEDALADCADGFGGTTRERALDIMRDSRIGTFGACAIGLSLLIRATAASAVAEHDGPWLAGAALVVVAGVSRTVCLVPLRLLPPARPEGLGAASSRPSDVSLAVAGVVAVGLSLMLILLKVGIAHLVAMCLIATAAALLVSAIAHRRIRGQTGDVIGAAQQVAECLALAALAAGP